MATIFQCDGGCGTTTSDPAAMTPVGYSEPQMAYCAACLPAVRQFLADRDALHTRMAHAWQTELAFLMATWHTEHPDGKLPDE